MSALFALPYFASTSHLIMLVNSGNGTYCRSAFGSICNISDTSHMSLSPIVVSLLAIFMSSPAIVYWFGLFQYGFTFSRLTASHIPFGSSFVLLRSNVHSFMSVSLA